MTKTTTGEKVRLSPGNWIALIALVLSQAVFVVGAYTQVQSRMAVLESSLSATVRIVEKLENRVLDLERKP